jgi:pimeloyl-ACP methyl ester carboxylesterase
MKVYFISGLGADRTIFKNLELPFGTEAVHLDWIRPLDNESLRSYATRLSNGIDPAQPFILIGLSFGGMLAVEISKLMEPSLLILISSVTCSNQLPRYYHWAGSCGLHKVIPIQFFRQASLMKRLFTTETSEDKKFLREMIRKLDPAFIKWALNAIVCWRNNVVPKNYIHIHGSGDLILPLHCVKPSHVIKGGGHLMIVNRAIEINRILNQEIPVSVKFINQ